MGADLNLFQFDYDTTWAAFFLSPDEQIYGRYGGRDSKSADAHISLAGLRYAMTAALAAHKQNGDKATPRTEKPLHVEDLPAARWARGCIHCHQVAEFQRDLAHSSGKWNRDNLWVYPPPENIGLTLEVDRGDRVKKVQPDSPAGRAGIQAGDTLKKLNGYSVASFADAQFALHKAPVKGEIPLAWERGGKQIEGTITLSGDWRHTNLTWRPSLLQLLPSLGVYGDDLSANEKKALGLGEKRLAFRQDSTVHRDARAIGVKAGDIIVGLNGQPMEMAMLDFLSHVRRNFLVGDRVTLNVLRDGKPVDLPVTLR